ncbi:hypothetical protein [Nonomuraea sp. SYSU D8015]|uniref:hypothetical protein n=1 Tax=Nonomuraea sp. SYSU D8015 TaxID=2593644 RepID=UPI001660AD2E|nr:hypothetical protein [Nonomuraea sp. SYSU D8015]
MHQARCPKGRRAAWTALAPAVALLLTSCGDATPATTAAPAARASASPSASSATPAETPSSTPSATPPSGSPAPRKPKDGRRLAACSDARCEVEVKAGDVIRFDARAFRKAGFADLAVKSVRKNQVVFDLASGAYAYTHPGPAGSANLNGISLTLVRIDGKRAVIRLAKPIKGETTIQMGPDGMRVLTPAG